MEQRKRERYRSYLVRLWHGTDEMPWRARVQDVHTGVWRTFATPEALLAFLAEQRQESAEGGEEGG